MKTTIYILAALFVMNFTLLSAGNPKIIIVRVNIKTDKIHVHEAELAPVTPKEAFFYDVEPRPLFEISRLAPITPKEAIFEDIQTEYIIPSISPLILQKIAPVTPGEADFEENPIDSISGIDLLAPVSPLSAAFEE
jgi:hypothetical protein